MARFAIILIFFVLFMAIPTISLSTIIHVPGDQPTIQDGIGSAHNGDTVMVASGVFTGNGNRDIDLMGKGIYLTGASGSDTTTIDCQGTSLDPHRAFYIQHGEDTATVINGFKIINAYEKGGAIQCDASSPIIQNCFITGNQSLGIYASGGSSLRLYGCQISENYLYGIYITNSTGMDSLIMGKCRVLNNSGTGIRIEQTAGVLNNVHVLDNDGDGVQAFWVSPVEFTYMLVKGNHKNGIRILQSGLTAFNISNCTVVSNDTGIYFDFAPPKIIAPAPEVTAADGNIINSIVAFNARRGIVHGGMVFSYHLECNDAFGNPDGNYVNMPYYPNDSVGDISYDPIFCDTTHGDYTIANISPCASAYNSCHVDIGYYGIGCTRTFLCGDANSSGTVNILDVSYIINYLYKGGAAPNPWQSADVNHSWSINILDVSYLINNLYKHGPALNCP
ncbi:hypothetical protein TRIP_C20430 [Candidatus Zixiibacteriota bacterium]|nr:hypothetical protein TRIP_C20430 [candidate division Zixibacteria bacterium]